MACFLNLSETKYHSLIKLDENITQSSTVKIDGNVVATFDNPTLFTEEVPNVISFSQLSNERTDNSYIINENIIFRLGVYRPGYRNDLNKGLACIRLDSNVSTSFSIEGETFVVCDPSSSQVLGVQVNLGATKNDTAYNIAEQINRNCSRVIASCVSNYIFICRKYDNELRGKVNAQYVMSLPNGFSNDGFSFDLVMADSTVYKFVGVLDGPEQSDPTTHTEYFKITSNNFENSFRSLQRAMCRAKVVGFCDASGTTLTLYCSDDVVDLQNPSINPSAITYLESVTPSTVVDNINPSVMYLPELVNIDGGAGKSIIAQIANNLVMVYGTDPTDGISNVEFVQQEVTLYIPNDNVPEFINYIGCIRYDYQEYVSSVPLLDACTNYLINTLSDYSATEYGTYSVSILTDSNNVSSDSEGINIYSIGSEEYPSDKNNQMSQKDFIDYINTVYDDIDLIVSRGTDTQVSVAVFDSISRRLTLNISFVDIYPKIERSFLKFKNCSNVNINMSRSRIHIQDSSAESDVKLFEFERCSGSCVIDVCEILISDTASVFSSNGCSNFEVKSLFTSYLIVSSQSDTKVFSFVNDYITLTTFGNVIDKHSTSGSCTFYNFNGTNGKINVNEGYSDLYRANGDEIVNLNYYNSSSFFIWPISDNSKSIPTAKKILCGLATTIQGIDDNRRIREFTFNPTNDSDATNTNLSDKPNTLKVDNSYRDVFNRPRKLSKFYGKTIITMNATGSVNLTSDDWFSINGNKFDFKDYLNDVSDSVDNETFTKIVANIISYNTDLNSYAQDTNGHFELVSCGMNEIVFCDNLKTEFQITEDSYHYIAHNGVVLHDSDIHILSTDYYSTLYIIDYGARQLHTDYDIEYYVDTEGTSDAQHSYYRQGTKDDKFYCKDMVSLISLFYPRFGNTKFILYGNANNIQQVSSFALTRADSILYGDVCMSSTFHGLREVPVFLAETDTCLFEIGCNGDASFTFDNIMIAATKSVIKCNANKPETKININNCVVKSYSGSVIDSNVCPLTIFESTVIGNDTNIVSSSGIFKAEANIFGVGNESKIEYDSTLNKVVLQNNYYIEDASTNCLTVAAIDFSDITHTNINSFKLEGVAKDAAINMIPNIYSLTLTSPTRYLDIGGRYRCKENEKTSIDAGAIESEEGLIEVGSEIFYVTFDNCEITDHGNANYISWDDFRNKFEKLTELHKDYFVYLSGYANDAKPLHIASTTAFYEQASLHFIAEKDCVFEGESLINAECNYPIITVEGLTAKVSDSFIKALGTDADITLLNCFLLTKTSESSTNLIELGTTSIPVSLLSCSIIFGNSGDKLINANSTTLYCIGCAIQGNNNDLGVDINSINVSTKGKIYCYGINGASGSSKCVVSNEDILDSSLCSSDVRLYSDSSKLLPETINYDGFAIVPDDVSNTSTTLYSVLAKGMSLTWNRDISNNVRKLTINPLIVDAANIDTVYYDNKLYCSPGCYNSVLEDVSGFYDDTPNREITCITEIGRTMITRMLSNTVRFQIEGFALCSNGYDFTNPVMSIKSEDNIHREQIKVTINNANLPSDLSVRVGNKTLYYGTGLDFEGTTKSAIVRSLVKAINKISPIQNSDMSSSSSFGASIVDASNGVFVLNKIMPVISSAYEDSPSEVSFNSTYFSTEVVQSSTEYNPNACLEHQVFPDTGILSFDAIEYLPLAISLYYKIDRNQFNGGFGSEVVLARVTECKDDSGNDDSNLVGYIFPLCICNHGLITKNRDSFIVGRIIIQL